MLNQLFNRGLLGAKCKTCLTLGIAGIKLLQNRRDVQTGQEAIARIRAAYEIIETFCEFILARVPILESQRLASVTKLKVVITVATEYRLRECPPELLEAIASLMFAAPRCSDLTDLLQVKNLFAAKYGKEFVSCVSELRPRPDSGVNRTIIEKLSVSAPAPELRLKVLKDIAREYGVPWDPCQTEAELNKKHKRPSVSGAMTYSSDPDIYTPVIRIQQDGSKRGNEDVLLKAPIVQQPLNSPILAELHSYPALFEYQREHLTR
ncbi:IST1-like protein [Drosera capensis]